MLASFTEASSSLRLVTVLHLTGQYLASTTDMKILNLGFSTKDKGKISRNDKVLFYYLFTRGNFSVKPKGLKILYPNATTYGTDPIVNTWQDQHTLLCVLFGHHVSQPVVGKWPAHLLHVILLYSFPTFPYKK